MITVFALKIFKDNHNITKVEVNIFLFKSTQQTKWYLAEAVTTQMCFAKKHSEILGIILRNTSVVESFFSFRPAVLLKKRLMNGQFPVSSCKHVNSCFWFRKYLTTLTVILHFVDIWIFGAWSNLKTMFRAWCFSKIFL